MHLSAHSMQTWDTGKIEKCDIQRFADRHWTIVLCRLVSVLIVIDVCPPKRREPRVFSDCKNECYEFPRMLPWRQCKLVLSASNKEAAAAAAAIARPEVLGREGWANRTRTSAAPQLPQETVGRMQRRDGQKGEEEELSRDDRRRGAVREPLKPRLNQHSFTASNGDPNSSRHFRQGCEALK